LARHQRLALERHRCKRAAAGKQGAAIGADVSLLRRALGLGGGVGQREHDRALFRSRHRAQHFRRERCRPRGHTDDGGGLEVA
jgi:hypothetical protein